MTASGILAFAHVGDLHVADAGRSNYRDLLSILAQIEAELRQALDFVVVPGDCADNGLARQYRLIAAALRLPSLPVHVIPGDHDMEQGSLANFYAGLSVPKLPHGIQLGQYRCLFLDYCSNGSGGPDFRLGADQLAWLEAELDAAAGDTPLLFMHSYPADLRGEGEPVALTRLIAERQVALVDIGHTHYNELANDGVTIFAATRSTGQIDEGPVGFSVATLDDGVVSWRFKLLDDPLPFVMITTPSDHRLQRGPQQPVGAVGARVFGAEPIDTVELRLGQGEWTPMTRQANGVDWRATPPALTEALVDITVRAFTTDGRPGLHMIRAAGPGWTAPARVTDGSDGASIGAWPENGILGTQLGPNQNGRKW